MFGFEWVVPWTNGEVINTLFLAAATIVVVSVPVVYGVQANLRDPLARAILYGTSVTGLAFVLTLCALIAYHAGWNPDETVWNWLTRVTYTAVAIGKAALLVGIARIRRIHRNEVSRNPDPEVSHSE